MNKAKIRFAPLLFVLLTIIFSAQQAARADKIPAKPSNARAMSLPLPKIEMSREDLQVKPTAKPFQVTGEVVDAWCYASQSMGPGRGERHKPCALACIMGGVTPGIVDDQGTLYICAKGQGYKGCQDILMPFVAKRVRAEGWLTTKGGCNVMKLTKVEAAK